MKVLIWLGSFFVSFFVSALIDLFLIPFGVRQGWIVRTLICVALPIFIAKKLCDMWDIKSASKGTQKIAEEIEKTGTTKEEYIRKNIPTSCIEICERCRGRRVALESSLFPFVKSGAISKKTYQFLLEEYSDK